MKSSRYTCIVVRAFHLEISKSRNLGVLSDIEISISIGTIELIVRTINSMIRTISRFFYCEFIAFSKICLGLLSDSFVSGLIIITFLKICYFNFLWEDFLLKHLLNSCTVF